jgi:methylated-DNA-protein-cysteine methyltransferase related protein
VRRSGKSSADKQASAPPRSGSGRSEVRSRDRARPLSEASGDRDLLRQRVLATVDDIPRGKVATYGDVAREAGLGRRARFVGRVLRELPSGTSLAWHRVVQAGGAIAIRAGWQEQRRRLAREGVPVDPRGKLDLARHRWRAT